MDPNEISQTPGAAEPTPSRPQQPVPIENTPSAEGAAGQSTPFSQTVDNAQRHGAEAAGAFRRGEFMQNTQVDSEATGDDRLIALLTYLSQVFVPVVMPIIVLLSESSKKRPFQRYHAVQSLAFTVVFVVLAIAAWIGVLILQIIPIIGQLIAVLAACLTPILYFMWLIALLYYGFQSYQGKRFAIPGLTSFLRDQGWLH